jgi:hypothetical protein
MPKNQEDIIINDIIQYNKFAILNIDRDNLATDVVKAVITHFFSSNGTHIPDAPHSETLVIFLIKTTTSIKHHFIAIETLQSFSKTLGEKFGKLVDVYNNLIKQKPVVVDTPLNISLSFEYIMQIFDKGVVEHYAGPFYASLLAHQIEPLSLLHSLISGNNLGEFMKNPAVMQKLMITLLNMQSPPCARLFYLYLFRKKVALYTNNSKGNAPILPQNLYYSGKNKGRKISPGDS